MLSRGKWLSMVVVCMAMMYVARNSVILSFAVILSEAKDLEDICESNSYNSYNIYNTYINCIVYVSCSGMFVV